MMLILAFAYVLSRVQFVYAAVVGAVSIVIYDVLTVAFASDTNTQFLVANYFLVVFAFVGMAASYGLDGPRACCSCASGSWMPRASAPTSCCTTPCPPRSSSG